MAISQNQLLKAACFSADQNQVRNLLSRTDYTDYLGSSDGYRLLCSMLENSIFSSKRYEQLRVSRTLFDQYLSQFLAISKSLLEHGVKVNDNNQCNTNTPLHLAVRTGNEEIVETLLSKGAEVNATNQEGDTPLHLAVVIDSKDICLCLLENGADIEIRNSSSETPYETFCEESMYHFLYVHKIKQFLDKGGNIEQKDVDDRTLLHQAVDDENEELIELLLNRGCNVNAPTEFGETPLHLALENGFERLVLPLLQNGASVNATTDEGSTPLHYAAKSINNLTNGCDILNALIKKGANIKAKDKFGLTPLNYAVKNGRSKAARILLGDNPDPKDKNLKTAFCLSFLDYKFEKIYSRNSDSINKEISGSVSKLFFHLGFTISSQDIDNVNIPKELYSEELIMIANAEFISNVQNLLNKRESSSPEEKQRECLEYHILVGAVRFGFVDTFHNLLTPSVNVNATLADGYTLLHHASEDGHLTIVNELLSRGADVNAIIPVLNWSPLYLSVTKDSADVSEVLLKKAANIEACNSQNETPLFLAVRECSLECISLLLEAGANANVVNSRNECSLHWALCKRNTGIVEILLHYGAYVNKNDSFQIKPFFDSLGSFLINTEAVDLVFNYGAKMIDIDSERFFMNKEIFKQLQVKAVAANLEDFRVSVNNPELAHYQTKCLEEIETMKRTKISECDITLHDLLIMPNRRVAIYMRNEKIVEFFDSIDFGKFPIYASKLKVCSKRGKLEKRLLELSYHCIEAIVKIQLPSVVISEIQSYFDTADMHRLIIASPIDSEMKKSVQYKLVSRPEAWNKIEF